MKKYILIIGMLLIIVSASCKTNPKEGFLMRRLAETSSDKNPSKDLSYVSTFLEGNRLDSLAQLKDSVDYFYFNDRWILGADINMVPQDSISKIEIKNDEYGNRCAFVTLPSLTFDSLKKNTDEELEKLGIFCTNLDPSWEFPGGMRKMMEWKKDNLRIPEEFKGVARVVVNFTIQPDGTVTDAKIIKGNENEELNREALQLVSSLPKFDVTYFTPKKEPILVGWPIKFEAKDTLP